MRLNIPGLPSSTYRWYVAPDQSSIFIKAGLSGREERVIKSANLDFHQDSKTRTIFFLSLQPDFRLIVKRYKIYNFLERLKSFFSPSKAKHEFTMHRYLKAKGIPVAQPIAFLECKKSNILQESYLFLTEIPNVVTLKQYISDKYPTHPEESNKVIALTNESIRGKRDLLKKLAEIIRRLHSADFCHDDLHIGNILVQQSPPEPVKLYLTDFHRGRRLWMMAVRKINNLGNLCYSLRLIFPLTDIIRFLVYYRSLDLRRETIKPFTKQVLSSAQGIKLRYWQSRTKRCLKKSTYFAIDTVNLSNSASGQSGYSVGPLKIYHRRSLQTNRIIELIKQHNTLASANPEKLFKATSKRAISLLVLSSDERCYIKEYRYSLISIIGNLFRRHPAKSDWFAHNGLKVRKIPIPEALAMAEEKFGIFTRKAYLIVKEVKDALPSGQYALNNFTSSVSLDDKKLYLKEFALAIAHLHQYRIFHADLKANNILVTSNKLSSKGGPDLGGQGASPQWWRFYFLDLDRVRFNREITWLGRIKNLAQLNAATPGVISRADRLRFLHYYLSGFAPLSNTRRNEIIAEIMRQTILRGHIWPGR